MNRKGDAMASNENERGCSVVLTGDLLPGKTPVEVQRKLSRLLNKDPAAVAEMLQPPGKIIQKNVSRRTAGKIKARIEAAGAQCRIQTTVSELPTLPSFNCPKCGFTIDPTLSQANPDGSCPACGVIMTKYLSRRAPSGPTPPEKSGKAAAGETRVPAPPGSRSSEFLPTWILKAVKWGFAGLGGLIFLHTGVSVFDTPAYEMLYRLNPPQRICIGDALAKHHPEIQIRWVETGGASGKCIKTFKLDMVNSGWKPQPQTVVRLKIDDAMQECMAMEPTFFNFDRAPRRDIRVLKTKDGISYALGRLQPFDHVTLRFELSLREGRDLNWSDVLDEIKLARGDVREGRAPKLTVFTRLALAALSFSIKDTSETIVQGFLDGSDEQDAVASAFDQSGADLAVSIQGDKSPYTPRREKSITLKATNRGPVDAENVRLSFQLPAGVRVVDYSRSQDNYTPTMGELLKESRQGPLLPGTLPEGCLLARDGTVTCTFKRLLPDESARIRIRVRIQEPGTFHCWAEVHSDTTDPDDSDNRNYQPITVQALSGM